MHRAFLIFSLLLLGTGTALAAIPAQQDADQRSILLTTRRPDGSALPVDGIVCDNLRDAPTGQKNHLDLMLPESFSGPDTLCGLANPDGSTADANGHNNVGSVVFREGHFAYYPPDEFNTIQEPARVTEVDGTATRIVLLTVRRQMTSGEWQALPPKQIVLARPPTILVHGINAGPDCWIPFVRAIASRTGADKKPLEFPFITLDHCTPGDYDGVSFRDRAKYPDGFFAGCGPVEVGAALLSRLIQQTLSRVRSGAPLPLLESQASGGDRMSFSYHAPDQTAGPALRLAIRRVDIVAWSYGGTIARWYIASNGALYPHEAAWYRGRYVMSRVDGRPIDLCPRVQYHGDVRKLITIGSLWRGVPLDNYLAEIRFSRPYDSDALAAAPLHFPNWVPKSLVNKMGANRTLAGLVEAIDANMKVITPASEVCAVDSRWLYTLNYGTSTYGTSDTKLPRGASPFRDEIAYGSVAGDDSAYLDFEPLKGISLYGATLFFQQPSRYPFHQLERRAGAKGSFSPLIGGVCDYSDGLVPLWSALIPGNTPGASQIVHASHGTYLVNHETQEYVERWLSHAALPTGRVLRPQWNTPISTLDKRKCWVFQDGEMAPQNLAGLYARIDGIARIHPDALYPDRTITVKYGKSGVVRVEWPLPAGGRLHRITVYEDATEAGAGPVRQPSRRYIVPAKVIDGRLCAIFEGPPKGRSCSIVVEGIIDNSPDLPVIIKSKTTRLVMPSTGAARQASNRDAATLPSVKNR